MKPHYTGGHYSRPAYINVDGTLLFEAELTIMTFT